MFQPDDGIQLTVSQTTEDMTLEPATSQKPPLYKNEDEYCEKAIFFTKERLKVFNYTFDDMRDEKEIYRNLFFRISPYRQFHIGLQSLDSLCKYEYKDDNPQEIKEERDFNDENDKENACLSIQTEYPNLFQKYVEFIGNTTFQDTLDNENILLLESVVQQNKKDKLIEFVAKTVFSDKQICNVSSLYSPDGAIINECNCPEITTDLPQPIKLIASVDPMDQASTLN